MNPLKSPISQVLSRHTPLHLSGVLTLKNRVVVPPMASETSLESGAATAKTLAHYARLAESGAGIVFVEYTFVHSSGRSEDNQLGLISDEHEMAVREIARVIRATGAVPGLQLTHGGGKSDYGLTYGRLMSPSGIPVPVKGREMPTPQVMSLEEIELWVASFTEAAVRAYRAGFPLVELHAAHGYGINQWLSGYTNRRSDEYGGSLEKRYRILREIITSIRTAVPEITLAVRMPGQDFIEQGVTSEDAKLLAQWMVHDGVAIIDVSSGLGGWRRPDTRAGQGYLVPEAAGIQSTLDAPVIGVGGIETGDYIDRALRERHFQLAAVGRAILNDPAAWQRKNLQETDTWSRL